MPVPTKMTVKSFKNPDFSGSVGEYDVRINPEKYSQTYEIKYNATPAVGAMNASLQFDHMPPKKMQFELVFDATGAIPNSATDLATEIKNFQSVVYDYSGTIHEPYYLKIYWGSMYFGARLTAMTVNYTLFRPDGAPLRARVNVTFTEYIDPATLAKQEGRQSPDMTHVVTVKAGDNLPLLSYEIYGDVRHYLQVAQANGLNHFRELKPGDRLVFPPLD